MRCRVHASAAQEAGRVFQPQWPENGDQWSDGEERTDMDCGLLQAMAEEDEEINLYNDETFGMDVDAEEAGGSPSSSLLQYGESPPAPHVSPPVAQSSPSPPRPRLQYLPQGGRGQGGPGQGGRGQRGQGGPEQRGQGSPGQGGRGQRGQGSPGQGGRGQRGQGSPGQGGREQRGQGSPGQGGRGQRGQGSPGQGGPEKRGQGGPELKGQRPGKGRAQMFEDPAVMRMVEGRPSLKSLDSAIVDCGTALSWASMDPAAWMVPSYRKTRRTSGSILQDNAIVCVIDGHGGRGHRMNSNFLDVPYPFSSFRGRRGAPRGLYRPFGQRAPPQPLTPKMMQLRFGANSPRPSPFYSPSSNPVQQFRYPGPVTQLHPQHKRLLIQKRTSQRKVESWDPYCSLMSAKEKEWITRLQMIQLQSENPYLEDYYYQEYYRRIEAKLAEEELGIRSKREPPKLTTPYITKMGSYTPVVHIEGSLGQVAVSTCYSPRRAIGAVHASPSQTSHEEHKDNRQQRLEVLNKIEKLFIVLLEVEEAERMKTTVLAEVEERRLMEKTQRKVEHIYSQLQHHDSLETGEEFLSCLLVSKGKKLLSRLLPFLDHDSALKVLGVVTSDLPTLMSRDTDDSLPVLYPPLRTVIGSLTFSQLIQVLKDLTASESLGTYDCLTLACQNKFGLSLLYMLLSQGEKLLSSGVPLEPSIGDFETWTDTIFQVAGQLSQCSLVEPLLLPSNLLTLFCRYLDKRTVHQLKSNME
ncbi:protein PAT1 homolog 2-like [Polymixia lowei]